jgi:hypothetical protein
LRQLSPAARSRRASSRHDLIAAGVIDPTKVTRTALRTCQWPYHDVAPVKSNKQRLVES